MISRGKMVFKEGGKVALIEDFPFWHRFSTLKAGNMSLRWDDEKKAKENFEKFSQIVSFPSQKRIHLLPQFGSKFEFVCKKSQNFVKADALILREKGVLLSLFCADCFPILLGWKEGICLVHGGKVPLKEGILRKSLRFILWQLKVFPSEIKVAIGPGIRFCCYPEDLLRVIYQELLEAEIPLQNIFDSKICTFCAKDKNGDFLFFSHQRAKLKNEKEGRFATLFAL